MSTPAYPTTREVAAVRKQRKQGRGPDYSRIDRLRCTDCGGELDYSGTIPKDTICLGYMDVAHCRNCEMTFYTIWVERQPVMYAGSFWDVWPWQAGERQPEVL